MVSLAAGGWTGGIGSLQKVSFHNSVARREISSSYALVLAFLVDGGSGMLDFPMPQSF